MCAEVANLAIVNFDDGRPALLAAQRRCPPSSFTFPGGPLTFSETPLNCALRRTREVAGLEFPPDRLALTGSATCVQQEYGIVVLTLFHLFLHPKEIVTPFDLLPDYHPWTWIPLELMLSANPLGNFLYCIPIASLLEQIHRRNSEISRTLLSHR